MSYFDVRNSVAVGLGGIISLISNGIGKLASGPSLLMESGSYLLKEDSGHILLE